MKEEVLKIIEEEYEIWRQSATIFVTPVSKWKTHQVINKIKDRIKLL